MSSDEEYVKKIAQLYNIVLSLRKDEDYAINQVQMDKLISLYSFFIDLANESPSDFVDPLNLRPKEVHGGVTATFLVFDVYGDRVQRFCEVLSACSAVSIDVTGESVCISCTVPNVFIPKSQAKLN